MFRSEKTAPKTSLASSSNGNTAIDVVVAELAGIWSKLGGGDEGLVATTIPDTDERVFRGLLNGVPASVAAGVAAIALDTPGSIPPSPAGRGRFVRCQSW